MAVTQVRRLHALTALRFVAAAMIVVHHSPDVKMLPPAALMRPFLLFQAVSFFFVLSGFILTYVYPSLDSWNDRGRFLFARFARVWPAHLATFILVIAVLHRFNRLELTSWPEAIGTGAINLTLIQSWFMTPAKFFSFNGVSWSISTEFAFYLFFPFLIYRWERTWWWKMLLTAGLAAAMIALARFLKLPSYSPSIPRTASVSAALVYINPLARVFEFSLGMFTALVWRQLGKRLTVGPVVGTLFEAAAFGLVLLNMYYAQVIADAASHVSWLGEPAGTWLQQGGAVCFSFALLVFAMAAEWGWLSYALSAPLGILLGEISFSVYLVHQILLREYAWKFQVYNAMPRWIVFPVYFILVLLISHLIWTAVERPFRTWMLSLWPKPGAAQRRPAPAPAAAGAPANEAALQKTLETPGGKERSIFHAFLEPGWRVAAFDAALIVAILVPVVIRSNRPFWLPRTTLNAASLKPQLDNASVHDIAFGPQLILRAASLARAPDGWARLTLIWESQQDTRLKYGVGVHLLKPDGSIGGQADFPQNAQEPYVHAHQWWVNRVDLSPAKLKGISSVGIALFEPGSLVPISSTPAPPATLDWNNRRLVIPLPPVPGAAAPASAAATIPATGP